MPYHHHPPPHHHHCHQASPPGQPNLTRWRSRWSSTGWPLTTSKTPTAPLQITLPNTWSVFFLFVLLIDNSRPYPDHPPPPAPFLQTKAPLSLSQTLPSFTPSQVTGMLMAMMSQDSSGQDSALLTFICSGFLGQVRRLTL